MQQWIEKGEDWWERTLAAEKALEAELFAPLPFEPWDLSDRVAAQAVA